MFRFGDPGGRIYAAVGAGNVNLSAWWGYVGLNFTGAIAVSAGGGRGGGSCLRFTTSGVGNSSAYVSKTLDQQPTWGLALAVRASASANTVVAGLWDAGSPQCDLRLNGDGTLSVTRNGTVLGTTSWALPPNSWAHVEWKVTIHPSAGSAALWVNGTQMLNLLGVNTRSTGNSSANQVGLGIISGITATFALDVDDFIVYDGQAADANGFADITGPIGDCGLAWLLPTGAGATTQFTPDSGSNYARVNEAIPDGDTSYVESATVGNVDTYAMADLPAAASAVKSVASVHYARKTDVGSRGIKAELRSAGGNAAHATEIALGNSYQYYFSNWGRDPNNGTPADWTVAAVNALEAGQTVSS